MSNITVNVNVATTKRGAVYVRVTTTSISLPYKVFAIEVLPKSKDNLSTNYRFSHVCSVSEIEELPTDEPDQEHCYFRTNDIGMLFDTASVAALAVAAIKDDVRKLADEYDSLYELITGGTITPEPPGPDNPGEIPNIYYEDL